MSYTKRDLAVLSKDNQVSAFPTIYCLMTQTLISGWTSAWSLIGTR
jgi:hypothetical protein